MLSDYPALSVNLSLKNARTKRATIPFDCGLSQCPTKNPLTGDFLLGIHCWNDTLRTILCLQVGAPTEIRTPVLSLKGMRPGPLDDGGSFLERANSIIHSYDRQAIIITGFSNKSNNEESKI